MLLNVLVRIFITLIVALSPYCVFSQDSGDSATAASFGQVHEFPLQTEWPRTVSYPDDITVEIVKESRNGGGSLYRTNHFELTSDIPLTRGALCQVLEVMEATLACWKALPIDLNLSAQDQLYPVRLVSNEDTFLQVGGIRGAGGIYLPENQQTLIRIDALQPGWTKDGQIASIEKQELIAHEVTHQIQHELIGKLPIWLLEGMAVYIESVPFHDGTFQFDEKSFHHADGIRRCTRNEFQTLPLKSLMTLTPHEWNHNFITSPKGNDRQYLTAYLLTYFLFHSEGTGDMAALRNYIRETLVSAAGTPGASSALEALFALSCYDALEIKMQRKYEEWGFKLSPLQGHIFK